MDPWVLNAIIDNVNAKFDAIQTQISEMNTSLNEAKSVIMKELDEKVSAIEVNQAEVRADLASFVGRLDLFEVNYDKHHNHTRKEKVTSLTCCLSVCPSVCLHIYLPTCFCGINTSNVE